MDPAPQSPDSATSYSIDLFNGASALQEIYYAKGRGSLFTYPQTRQSLRNVGFCVAISAALYGPATTNQTSYIVCFIVMLIVTIVFLTIFVTNAIKYLKWKKGVDDYIRNVDELGSHQLKLNPLTFELINKNETVIQKWSTIKNVKITPELITLVADPGSTYQFPAKAMDQSNYQLLQDIIRQRVQFPEAEATA